MGIIKILLKKKRQKWIGSVYRCLYNAILCITSTARIWISRLNVFESYITVTGKTITEGVKFPELHNYSEPFWIYLLSLDNFSSATREESEDVRNRTLRLLIVTKNISNHNNHQILL